MSIMVTGNYDHVSCSRCLSCSETVSAGDDVVQDEAGAGDQHHRQPQPRP